MSSLYKVRKRAKIRNRYNQAPHLTQNTNGKVTKSQLGITNESQEVSSFPAGDNKASVLSVPCSLVIICWESADLFDLLLSCVFVISAYDVSGKV